MDKIKELGLLIKEKRLLCNLSMDQLAKMANITRSTLWAIEKGKSNCSIKSIFTLLEILDIKINFKTNKTDVIDRERATRINSTYDKKISQFLVMCIEQYALENNLSSKEAYKIMENHHIIDDLKNDYEDLHGMSTLYINDHIKALIEVRA